MYMTHAFRLISLFIFMIIISCNSNKGTTEINNIKPKIINTNYLEEGYVKAVLLSGIKNSSDCKNTIKVDPFKELLDPINLNDFDFKIESDNSKVWVKYAALRMRNRCTQARPIKVLDIKKRDD